MRKKIIHLLLLTTAIVMLEACSKSSDSSATTGAGGSTARFTISGTYLYVVDHTSVKAFDITNPLNPVLRSKTEVGINIETIFPYQDKLFIGSSFSMYIFSLADPARPVQLSRADYNIQMACDPVVAREGVAYATLRASGPCGGGRSALVTYNTTDISEPVLAHTFDLKEPFGLGLQGQSLYVCEGSLGLKVFNVSQPYQPSLVHTIDNDDVFLDVIPYGDILIAQVQGGFSLFDIATDPLRPTLISKITQ